MTKTLTRDKFGLSITIDGKTYAERNASEAQMFRELLADFNNQECFQILRSTGKCELSTTISSIPSKR